MNVSNHGGKMYDKTLLILILTGKTHKLDNKTCIIINNSNNNRIN